MASFSSLWILCPAVVLTAQVCSAAVMDANTVACTTGSEPAGLVGLLQKGALPLSKDAQGSNDVPEPLFAQPETEDGEPIYPPSETVEPMYPPPQGLGKIPIATEFADSRCTKETGTVYNLPLDGNHKCDFLWAFKCTCDEHGFEALRGRLWIDGNCTSQNYSQYILPVGVCFTLPQMSTYVMISDFSLCKQCQDKAGLIEEVPTSKANHSYDDVSEPADASADIGAVAAGAATDKKKVKDTEKIAPPQVALGNGERVLEDQDKPDTLIVRMYSDNKCTDLIEEYNETPSVCAAKDYLGGKPSATYNCKCNGDDREVLYLNWFADSCDPSQGVQYDYTFPAGKCAPAPTGLTWVKINAQACPKCCGDASNCVVHGDPHITVFDGEEGSVVTLLTKPRTDITDGSGREDMFDWGDYWLVKSERVFIQARYRKVYYPLANQPLNHTYLTAVAIGGPFLHGHMLIIEPRDGNVTWSRQADSESAMHIFEQELETEFQRGDVIRAIYHNRTAVVPEGKDAVPGLDVELPSGVKLFVDRFKKHLDFKVEMPADAGGPKGVDGQCGNYNGDASDDTADLIGKRMGFQVPAEELMFAKDSEEE